MQNILASIVSACVIVCHIVLGALESHTFYKTVYFHQVLLFFKYTLHILVGVSSVWKGGGKCRRTCSSLFPSNLYGGYLAADHLGGGTLDI